MTVIMRAIERRTPPAAPVEIIQHDELVQIETAQIGTIGHLLQFFLRYDKDTGRTGIFYIPHLSFHKDIRPAEFFRNQLIAAVYGNHILVQALHFQGIRDFARRMEPHDALLSHLQIPRIDQEPCFLHYFVSRAGNHSRLLPVKAPYR